MQKTLVFLTPRRHRESEPSDTDLRTGNGGTTETQ